MLTIIRNQEESVSQMNADLPNTGCENCAMDVVLPKEDMDSAMPMADKATANDGPQNVGLKCLQDMADKSVAIATKRKR